MPHDPTFGQLSQEFSVPLGVMCTELFNEIKKMKPKIQSIIIQHKDGITRVGHSDGMGFLPDYFDPTTQISVSPIISGILAASNNVVSILFEKINTDITKRQLKSYIVHYHGKTRCVTVCRNRIGSVGMKRCSLYDLFIA